MVEKPKGLEDNVEHLFKDENAQNQAVKSLISVEEKNQTIGSTDIELKTDLTIDEINNHTILQLIGIILKHGEERFKTEPIILDALNIRERKLLSKDRKSRSEIVEIVRHPEVSSEQRASESMLKKLFTPRNRQV